MAKTSYGIVMHAYTDFPHFRDSERRIALRSLLNAIDLAGGRKELADATGRHYAAVTRWLRQGYVPETSLMRVEEATGVPRESLRPDLFRGLRVIRDPAAGEAA